MVKGHLHKVILTFLIGKLLGEQQRFVYGCGPPLIVDICLNVQSSILKHYWGPFSFQVGEVFRDMTGCIGGLGVECRMGHDFTFQIAADFMKLYVLWFTVMPFKVVDPTLWMNIADPSLFLTNWGHAASVDRGSSVFERWRARW